MSALLRLSSPSQFRDAMARMPSSVSIVTTDGPSGKWGVTASAVCSVSDSPPMVLVCLNRESRAHSVIKKNLAVAINVLNEDQIALSKKFAIKDANEVASEFAAAHWSYGMDTPPVLKGAAVSLVGKVEKSVDASSHTVFFILVESVAIYTGGTGLKPVIYFNRTFQSLR